MTQYLAAVLTVMASVIGVIALARALLVDRRQKVMRAHIANLLERRGFRDLPVSEYLALLRSREFRELRNIWGHAAQLHDIAHWIEKAPGKKTLPSWKREVVRSMGPRTFYYIDTSQVRDLYFQAFQDLEPKQIETHEIQQTGKGISADLKLIAPKYDSAKSSGTKKTYEPELTPPVMYNKVEAYLIDKGEVSFGVEDFEYDRSAIDEFTSMCGQMRAKFNFDVPAQLQKQFVSDKLRGLALDSRRAIAQCSGFVAIQAELTVASADDKYRVLPLLHPLNQHLSAEDSRVAIQVICDTASLSPSGTATFTAGSPVKITCLGKVVRWTEDDATLTISPIAIY